MKSIAIEGLMRVGKTSSILRVRNSYKGIEVIPEIMPFPLIDMNTNRGDDFFIQNDLAKSAALRKILLDKKYNIVLLDRYFISTLAYMLSEMDLGWKSEKMTISDLIDRNYSNIVIPDHWIYIEESPYASWSRSTEEAKGGSVGWTDIKFVEAMDSNYRKLFSFLSLIKKIRISVINSSLVQTETDALDRLIFS